MPGATERRSHIDRRGISLIYCLVSVLAIGFLTLLGPLQDMVQLVVVTLLVMILGLPHGALDGELAAALQLSGTRARAVGFFAGYLALSICGIAFWLSFPALALSVFLLMSAYHFSDDWRAALGRPTSLVLGTLVLGLPALSHPDLVERVFSWLLVAPDQAAVLVTLLRFAAGVGLTLLVLALILRPSRDIMLLAEIVVLILSSIVLSPLLYFVIYFCLIHAQRHVLDCARFLHLSLLQCYLKSIPILMLTLIVAGISYFLFSSGDVSQNMARWLFIGLFALTIPHMTIITYWNRRSALHAD